MFFKIEWGKRKSEPDELRKTTIEDPGVPVNSSNILKVFDVQPSLSGVDVNEETALTFSAVYRCVTLISDTIASIPLNVVKYTDAGKEIDRKHKLYKLLHSEPCECYTSYEWRQLMEASALLWGNGYSKIIRNRATFLPEWFDFIHPSIVEPYQVIRNDGTKAIKYKIRTTGEVIDADNMIHIKAAGFDGIKGKSPIEVAAENIGLGLAAERFGADFFKNNASFNGILSTDQVLKKDQVDIVKESWQKAHAVQGERFKTPVLPFGFKYTMIGVPPEQAQFMQTRKFQLEEVARIYGVPLHMLASLDRATFSNIEQQSIEFVRDTMRPWCVKWEQELDRKLLREDEKATYFTKFNLEGLLRGDSTSRAAYLKTMVEMDIYTRNEAREYEDKNPLEGLDEPWSQTKYAYPQKDTGKTDEPDSPDDTNDGGNNDGS